MAVLSWTVSNFKLNEVNPEIFNGLLQSCTTHQIHKYLVSSLFSDYVLMKRRMQTTGGRIGYVPTKALLATSNIVESLLSASGSALSYRHSDITPEHFEQQMCLFVSSEYWVFSNINAILVSYDC